MAAACGGVFVVVEGELDALLLGQELEGLAVVLTLGSASSRPTEDTLRSLDTAFRLYLATDADAAGDRGATGWPAKALRVRPPEPHKDWIEAHLAGVDLRSWWAPRLFVDPHDREERAAIQEFDGGLTREAAERAAGLLPLSDPIEATPPEPSPARRACIPPPHECRQPPVTPERAAALARGDALRAAGLALPLCWLP